MSLLLLLIIIIPTPPSNNPNCPQSFNNVHFPSHLLGGSEHVHRTSWNPYKCTLSVLFQTWWSLQQVDESLSKTTTTVLFQRRSVCYKIYSTEWVIYTKKNIPFWEGKDLQNSPQKVGVSPTFLLPPELIWDSPYAMGCEISSTFQGTYQIVKL